MKYVLAGCALAAALGATTAAGMARAQPMGGPSGPSGANAEQQQQARRLHDALHLNPHQDQAWRAYQAGLQPSPDQAQRMRAMSQMSLAGMSTPQRLDLIDERLNMEVAAFHRTAEATRAFYATLNPDQQHSFDRITAPPSRGDQGR
jgi:protein CpxP